MNLRDYIPALKFGAKVHPGDILGGALIGMTTGNVYYIMLSTATEYANFKKEYLTTYLDGTDSVQNDIDTGINQCTADKGDVVAVTPGYTESVTSAADISADVAGITIMGLGNMNCRPILTFDTAATADINIGAQDIRISNISMKAGIDDLGMFLDVDDSYFQVDNCKFEGTSSYQAVNFINLATTKDNFKILDSTFIQDTDPAGTDAAANTGAIYLVDSENILVKGCYFHDQFETAIIHNKTTACKNLIVEDCAIHLSLSTAVPFELVAGAEGYANNVHGSNESSADVAEANLWGTLGTKFWLSPTCALGNDSGGGGQMGATGTVCS